jgi:hypothetical protein
MLTQARCFPAAHEGLARRWGTAIIATALAVTAAFLPGAEDEIAVAFRIIIDDIHAGITDVFRTIHHDVGLEMSVSFDATPTTAGGQHSNGQEDCKERPHHIDPFLSRLHDIT